MKTQWAIIGAGPAGIAAIGKLLDAGIHPEAILWIDPDFKVGDFGLKWRNVSSNTKVQLFIKFLQASPAFNYSKCPIDFKLNHLPPDDTCLLTDMASPLQWVSDHLRQTVQSKQTMAIELIFKKDYWEIKTSEDILYANNVILATGAEPSLLPLRDLTIISTEDALDPKKLNNVCGKDDTVAVFGSSHTAIVALYNLIDVGVKKIINFYRSPLKYALFMDDWILFDNTGLKGYSAEWARENIEKNLPSNLERIHIKSEEYPLALKTCNKAICAVGFKRRSLPLIKSFEHNTLANNICYNEKTGFIAPRLFGLGIGFPQGSLDQAGNYEHRVGLWKFMDYLTEVLPIWLQASVKSSEPHTHNECTESK